MQRFFYIFLFFTFTGEVCAQSQFRFKHITTNEGLSQNSVYAVFQDKEGFLWFGTQDGLNRFDGISFKVFKHNNDDSTSISDNYILGITEDSIGNLWIATRNGANRFDKMTETFHHYFFPEIFHNTYHQRITQIFIDNKGDVFIVLPSAIYSYSSSDNFQSPTHFFEVASDTINVNIIVQDSAHKYWVETTNGIYLIKEKEKRTFYRPESFLESFNGSLIQRNNKLWLSTKKGLCTFDIASTQFGQLKDFPIPDDEPIIFMSKDSHERVFVQTDKKFYMMEEKPDGTFNKTAITRDEGDPRSLNDENVRAVFEDRSGLLWFGTTRGGVNVYDPLSYSFKTFKEKLLKSIPMVWAVCEDHRRDLWIGTTSGLTRVTLRDTTKLITSFAMPDSLIQRVEKNPFPSLQTQVSSIVEDDGHRLWIGTRVNGVFLLDAKRQSLRHFEHIEHDSQSLVYNTILTIFKASNGEIWIGTSAGISIYNKGTNKFRSLYLPSNGLELTSNNYILNFFEDDKGIMWISTTSGLMRYDTHSGKFRNFIHDEKDKHSLSYNMPTACCEDAQGRLWVGTLGGGLNMFDALTENFQHYTSENGLSNDVVYGVLNDKNGHLWLSTNEGISRFTMETQSFTNFRMEEGLEFNEFAINSYFQNSHGEVFFGGVGGMLVFDPAKVEENSVIPPVVISEMKINYKPVYSSSRLLVKGGMTLPQEIHLGYLEKALSLEFVALNFRNSLKNVYAYKLDGFDDNWIYPERGLRTAHYTSLPSGEFTFIVKAANNSGVWNNEGLRIKIFVSPPFWLTWWFMSSITFFVLTTLVVSVRSYSHRKLRRKMREMELQQKIQLERERISRDLHDNVGSQLVNIISGLDIAERFSETSKEKTKSLLTSLQEDTRTSMALLRQTIWALKANELTIEQFVEELEEYVKKQCSFHEEITLRVEKHFTPSIALSPVQVLNLFRIIQEAIANTLKYASAKNISLSLSTSETKDFELLITDDGIGMQTTTKDPFGGNGLLNMERRAKELGGTFRCISNNGVTLEIVVPLNPK